MTRQGAFLFLEGPLSEEASMATVLIVDDEEPIRLLLRQMLERAGHRVTEACDGEEGIEAYRRGPADVVITDILMPKKGGLVLIRDLINEFPQAKILAVSGGGRDGKLNFLATARTYPGVKTLRKPFTRSDLLDALADLLPSSST
jgi:CheY-like chemotaxis protein